MSIATVSTIVIEAYSILFTTLNILDGLRIIGIVFGILAIIFFALATITMKDSWRVGIPEEKTSLISAGIYKWSKNPAFVGFDLLYISICLMYFNLPLLLISVFAGTMLHLQILQEEKHMQNMFEKIHAVTLKKDIAYAIIRITLCSAYKSTVQTEQTVIKVMESGHLSDSGILHPRDSSC